MQAPSKEQESQQLKERISVFVESLKSLSENFSSFLSGNANNDKVKEAEEALDKRSNLFCEQVLAYIKQYYIKQPAKLTQFESQGMAQHIGCAAREFYYTTNDYAYRNQAVAGFLSAGRLLVAVSGMFGTTNQSKISQLNSKAENLVDKIHGRVTFLNEQHNKGIKEEFANPYYSRNE